MNLFRENQEDLIGYGFPLEGNLLKRDCLVLFSFKLKLLLKLKNGKQQLSAFLRERLELRESFCHLDASRFPCLKNERENKGRKKEGRKSMVPQS